VERDSEGERERRERSPFHVDVELKDNRCLDEEGIPSGPHGDEQVLLRRESALPDVG